MNFKTIVLTLLIVLPLGMLATPTVYASAAPQTDISKATVPSTTNNQPAVGGANLWCSIFGGCD